MLKVEPKMFNSTHVFCYAEKEKHQIPLSITQRNRKRKEKKSIVIYKSNKYDSKWERKEQPQMKVNLVVLSVLEMSCEL